MLAVFLDIDGVLNNTNNCTSWMAHKPETYGIDENNFSIFLELVKKLNLTVFISSNWRRLPLYHKWFSKKDMAIGFRSPLKKCIDLLVQNNISYDVVPHRSGQNKYDDICDLLNSCEYKINDFIVLDDDDVSEGLSGFGEQFIKTNSDIGITESDCDSIIKYFRG